MRRFSIFYKPPLPVFSFPTRDEEKRRVERLGRLIVVPLEGLECRIPPRAEYGSAGAAQRIILLKREIPRRRFLPDGRVYRGEVAASIQEGICWPDGRIFHLRQQRFPPPREGAKQDSLPDGRASTAIEAEREVAEMPPLSF